MSFEAANADVHLSYRAAPADNIMDRESVHEIRWGAFRADGREFVINRPDLPRPWAHYLTNAGYGAWLTQTFDGASTFPLREGTVLNRSAIADRFARCIYLRDAQSGRVWNVNWEPIRRSPQRFACRQGLGYSFIESQTEDIASSLRFFVDRDEPVEFWTLTLSNPTSRVRKLQLFAVLEWHLGNSMAVHDKPAWYTRVQFDEGHNALLATVDEAGCPGHCQQAFMKAWGKVDGYTASRAAFLGGGTWERPALVLDGRSDNRPADAEEAIACLEFKLELQPGESQRIDLAVGMEHAGGRPLGTLARLEKLSENGGVQQRFQLVEDYWSDLTGRLQIQTPEPSFDRWFNAWMPYQLVQCCRWSGGNGANAPRSGFRDLLQVCLGMLHVDPQAARTKLLEALHHQYASGRAVRAWSVRGHHDTRDYRDSPVWIIFTLDSYLKNTGDWNLLDQPVPFLDGGEDSVLGHATRAIATLWNDRGTHGLSHIGEGDWLDPLNRCGIGGRGESVWLSMALHLALKQMAELHLAQGQTQRARKLSAHAQELRQAINENGWDGRWYLQALDNDGKPIGSSQSSEARCFLLPQAWAVFSGVADPQRAEMAMAAVEEHLRRPHGYVLFAPDYRSYRPNIGGLSILRMKRVVYSHANLFKIWAECHLGRGDAAMATFQRIDPTNPDHPPEQSLAEPYILPNGYCGTELAGRDGQVMYSGFSGAMPWTMKYAIEGLFGLQADHDGLVINPCIPSHWPSCRIQMLLRGAEYELQIDNPERVCRGVKQLIVNGREIATAAMNRIPFASRKSRCTIHCRLGDRSLGDRRCVTPSAAIP